ncbi:MAG: HlyD family efflux transporter periplasmic adaptor subunit [Dehalococcoidia bacterium]
MTVLLTQMLYRLRIQVIAYGLGLALWAALDVFLYPSVADSLGDIEYPEAILEAFGVSGTNLADPRAFFGAEFFSLSPLIIGAFIVFASTAVLAGEESSGTMEGLAALPFSRSAMFLQKALAVLVATLVVAALTSVGWVLSVPFIDLGRELTLTDLVRATFLQTSFAAFLLATGLFFGAVAPSRSTAAACTGGLLIVSYLVVAIASSVDAIEDAKYLSPYYYSDLSGVLVDGVEPLHQLVLWAATGIVGFLALLAFQGRELNAERWQFDALMPRGPFEGGSEVEMTTPTAAPAAPRRTRRGLSGTARLLILAVLVAVLLGGGFVAYQYTSSLPPTVSITGRVAAPSVEILAPTSGAVVTLSAVEGQTVSAGDLLGWMESALDRTLVPVTAPRGGRITSLALYQGQYATAGTPVVEIHELGQLHALLEVDESDIGRVAVGQRVELSFSSLGLRATGAVSKVGTLPTTASGGRPGQSRKYEVEVPLDGVDQRVIIGLPVDATIYVVPRS